MDAFNATLRYVFPKGALVSGMALLGCELCVIRYPCHQQIEVYDTATFMTKEKLTVPDLCDVMSWGHALASCAVNNCLYVTDYCTGTVHRVPVSGNPDDVVKWPTSSCPVGLSVNDAAHVLVTCCSVPYKIEEYTACGAPVREILLHSDVTYPYHAVQLSSDRLVVSHEGPTCGVSVIGISGQVLRNYRRQLLASSVAPLKCPRQLVVSKNECIYVADRDNNKVLRLFTNGCDEIRVSLGGGLQGPLALCLDESRGRLCIGEWQGGRVLVLDDVNTSGSSNSSNRGRRNLRF